MSSIHRTLPVVLGCVVLIAALSPYSKAVYAEAEKPNALQQISQLQLQIVSLERRLADLEKAKGAGAMPGAAAGSTKAPDKPGPQSEKPSQPMSAVRAPFVVQDERGNTIFRVEVAASGRPAVEIGDVKGAHVHLGPNGTAGASIALYDASNNPGIYLVDGTNANYVSVTRGKRAATILADDTSSSATVYNNAGVPGATLQVAEAGAGRLKISNPAGNILIDLGITADDIGWVRTSGPGGGGVSTVPGVPASYIRGWKK
ncbi:MAG: hypothetical protein WDO56_29545 [Gammaproteobacteria bacterium]